MRVDFRKKEGPKIGNYRVCGGFLWWPKLINHELRWLERASWVERYMRVEVEISHGNVYEKNDWVETHWFGNPPEDMKEIA